MDPVIIAFILLLATITLSRMLVFKGMAILNEREKSHLISIFSTQRMWNLIGMFGFAAIYLAIINYQPQKKLELSISYLVIVLVVLFYITNKSVNKLKANNFNPKYVQYFILSNVIRGVGISAFFIFLVTSIS